VHDSCYCEHCVEKLFVQCENCSEYIDKDEVYESPDGEYLCENCFSDKYTNCDCCDDVIENDNDQENKNLCENCQGMVQCTACHNWSMDVKDGCCADCNCDKMMVVKE
jgi:hypothetical protein